MILDDHTELDLTGLDDPEPFVPDADLKAGAVRRGSSRTRRRRLRFGAIGVVATLVLLVAGYGGYQKWHVSQMTRLELADSLDPPASDVPADSGEDPPPAPSQALNILVVGSDQAMPGVGRDAVTDIRTDTMMVVRADPGAGTINVLSLPRDLWVDIPGHGKERINTAWETGGPALLIDTIKANFGIPVNHFLQVDGNGFERLVDQAGGTNLWVAGELRDTNTGFAAAGPACVHLDGTQALALVRSRHLELNDPVRGWTQDPASDLGRIERQQLLGRVLASSLLSQDLGIGAADELLDTLIDNAAIDSGWSIRDMAGLLFWAQGLDLGTSLTMATPPVVGTYVGQASVLELQQAAAEPLFARFRGDAPSADGAGPNGAPSTTAAGAPATPADVRTGSTADAAQWVLAGPPDGSAC